MIKLCHIITSLEMGGAQRILLELSERLNNGDYEQIVINLSGETVLASKLKEKNITVYSINLKKNTLAIGPIYLLFKILVNTRPNIVLTWLYHSDVLGGVLAKILGVPTIIWYIHHANKKTNQEKLITRIMILFGRLLSKIIPNKIVYCSFDAKNVHEKILGYCSNNSMIISNGVDVRKFYPKTELDKCIIKQNYGIQNDKYLIGLVARYHPIKGHDLFIKGAAELRKVRRDVKFILSGNNVDECNENLTSLIKQYKLEDCVILTGHCEKIWDLYAILDINTCTSRSESFGLMLVEAMATGVPCVSTDIPVAASLLKGVGWLVPVNDYRKLANTWNEILNYNKHEKEEKILNARNKVVNEYNVDMTAKAFTEMFRYFYKKNLGVKYDN